MCSEACKYSKNFPRVYKKHNALSEFPLLWILRLLPLRFPRYIRIFAVICTEPVIVNHPWRVTGKFRWVAFLFYSLTDLFTNCPVFGCKVCFLCLFRTWFQTEVVHLLCPRLVARLLYQWTTWQVNFRNNFFLVGFFRCTYNQYIGIELVFAFDDNTWFLWRSSLIYCSHRSILYDCTTRIKLNWKCTELCIVRNYIWSQTVSVFSIRQ